MQQIDLPLYVPSLSAPERGVLTILHAALWVTERALRDEHPVDIAPQLGQHHAPVVVATARLIVDRCAELRALLDFYDGAVDEVLCIDDPTLPF